MIRLAVSCLVQAVQVQIDRAWVWQMRILTADVAVPHMIGTAFTGATVFKDVLDGPDPLIAPHLFITMKR